MIKATALKPVTTENMNIVADVLTKRSQNIKIEYSQQADLVPHAVEALACVAFLRKQKLVLSSSLRACMALCLRFITVQTVM